MSRTIIDTPNDVAFDHAIPLYRIGELTERFERLGKRAEKLGVQAPHFDVVGRRQVVEVHEISGLKQCREYELVVVVGPPVKLAGWEFVATIEHTEAGNLLRKAPHQRAELPVAYRTDPPTCDHCRLDRQRKETFVVRHEDGRLARVGRQCLRDFLGVDPEHAAALCAFVLECADGLGDDGLGGWGGGGTKSFRVEDFLAYCAADVRIGNGYRSRSRYDSDSTADVALTAMFPGKDTPEAKRFTPLPCDDALAANVLEWARTLPEAGLSDYLSNVRTACALEWMTWKHAGIVASAIASHVKAAERLAELDAVLDEPLAEPGVKIAGAKLPKAQRIGGRRQIPPLHVKLLRTMVFDGQYGTTTLHVFASEDGHRLAWWASSGAAHAFSYDDSMGPYQQQKAVDIGDWCWIGGSIKDVVRNKRDRKMETVLTRVVRCTREHLIEWERRDASFAVKG